MSAAGLVIGIDPGLEGAVAYLSLHGDLLGVDDIPLDKIQVGKGTRQRVAIPRLLALLKPAAGAWLYIEKPAYRPMKRRNPKTGALEDAQMGVAGAGAFGETYGALLCAAVACGCRVVEVSAGVWDRAVGLKGGPDDSRRLAERMFPNQTHLFARKRDDGRSDAALIGLYGTRELRKDAAA